MLTLYQETETARVCAKPWLRIGGQDYLYNYPTNSSDDMGIQADSSSSPITCEPSNIYEGTTIQVTFDTSKIVGADENTPITWSSSNPEILSVDDQGNARISSVQDGVWTVTVTAETDDGRTAAKEVSVLRQTQVSVSGYDSSVISVSEDGDGVTVSAVAAGSTAVTVSWGDSSRTVLISVS